MSFGIFLAPFHRVGEHPTLALKRDLKLIQHLDELGYDEAWIGEHHSFGRELIADPCLFIAAAAERTKRIRLGTGVTSLPYHHPLMVADRMVQLDHMTEGRAMLGVGPGALTPDAFMMGIPTTEQRQRMGESLDAIMQLLRGDEPVTMKTDWFELNQARLQLASYSVPHLPVAAAASFSPAGPTSAGKHGIGLLSVAGADNEAFERTWSWAEESAAEHGQTVSRDDWKVVVPIHIAETREQAIDEIRAGWKVRAYVGDRKDPDAPTLAQGGIFGGGGSLEEQVEGGSLLVGSPDDAVKGIESILERSGGLGGILGLAHEWAGTEATWRSYELFMRYVAPRFQGQLDPIYETRDWVEDHMGEVFGATPAAFQKAFEDAGKEMPKEMAEAMRQRAEERAKQS